MILATIGCAPSWAATIPVGYFSWDVVFPGNAGQFDVVNQTGPNSSAFPDTTFPISTTVIFSSFDLVVHFSNATTQTFGSSYFHLSSDGISFIGSPIPIGGANPSPIDATLTGTLSPLSISLNDGSSSSISPAFSATIPGPGPLTDGNLAIIFATTSEGPAVPEPGSFTLVGLGVAGLTTRKRILSYFRKHLGPSRIPFALSLCLVLGSVANAQVSLNTWTSPDTGVAGVNNVNITGSGFPAGPITPSNVTVTFSTTCGGAPAATANANRITLVLGSSLRVNVNIPASLAQADYFVQVSDSAAGDINFTSMDCSKIHVTRTNITLSACLPTSSIGVLAPTSAGPVTAYVPNGSWGGGSTGVQAVPIEGGGSPVSIATSAAVNSCSSNPATGQSVCTANTTAVYLITGTTLTTTVNSSSNASASFSGGTCFNCGVAINPLNNTAIINMGLSSSPSRSGFQMLNLDNNSFGTPVPATHVVSEDISVDPTRGLILSPGEEGYYNLYDITSSTPVEFENNINGGELDSAGEDCSTGIALSTREGTTQLFLTDLTQATFNAGAHTWTAPGQFQNFPEFNGMGAGTSGIAIAPGSDHLGVVSGEFGTNRIAVIKLPSTSGTGTPSVVDYAVVNLPDIPSRGTFSLGFDPHTITAYTSGNSGKAYGVFANSPPPSHLAVVDLAALLAAPRIGATHNVDTTAVNLLTSGIVRYVATH